METGGLTSSMGLAVMVSGPGLGFGLALSNIGGAVSGPGTAATPYLGSGVVLSSPFLHPTTLMERRTASADNLITLLNFIFLLFKESLFILPNSAGTASCSPQC